MNGHLTDDQLIKYQFKLDAEEQITEDDAHLQQCEQCERRLAELKRTFGALDGVMPQDVKASEELISQTLANIDNPPTRTLSLSLLQWIGAAAAVLLVGLGLLFGFTPRRQSPSGPAVAERDPQPSDIVSLSASRSDKPPFAPASNIELVTLPRRDHVQITIYNSADLTLVRERRQLTMKQGWNWLQFMWANTLIDPTSLSLNPLQHANEIEIQQLVFPPRLPHVGRWLIKSNVSGQVPFEITYFTSGVSGQAFYMGAMSADEKTMSLQGYVKVANQSGEDYEDAQTRLIVGKLHMVDQIAELAQREQPYNRRGLFAGHGGGLGGGGAGLPNVSGDLRDKEIKKEGLSEYFLYTI